MRVKLTKTGWTVGGVLMGPPTFGSLPEGHEITVIVHDDYADDAEFRARGMLKRSNPDENTMEWTAEVLEPEMRGHHRAQQ